MTLEDEIAALARLISLNAEDTRTRLDLIDAKLDNALTRLADKVEDNIVRISRVERELVAVKADITLLQQSAERRIKKVKRK